MKFICATLWLALAFSEPIEITNKEGKKLLVELVDFAHGNLSVKLLSNRKTYRFPLSTLDENSQKTVNNWLAEDGHLTKTFTFKYEKRLSSKRESVYKYSHTPSGGDLNTVKTLDYKEITHTAKPKIMFKHDGKKQTPSPPVELIVYVLGESGAEVKAYQKESFQIPSLKNSVVRSLN